MNVHHPFTAADLAELDARLLARATSVVAMEDVLDGNHDARAIGMRHDVDAWHALATAVRLAEWEADRGYRSTYYVLHTSPYWGSPGFADSLYQIAAAGHEIGIHSNALAESLRTGRDPDLILEVAIRTLRNLGFAVRGVAGHGDPFCNRARAPGEITFANDEQFVECARPQEGEPDRVITRGKRTLKLAPRPLADFGLEYEALNLANPFPFRISDSGGQWLKPGWPEIMAKWNRMWHDFPGQTDASAACRQMHFLMHPDWWAQAFARDAVAA